MLEALEERWCPAAGTDTLLWNPAAGSQDASQAANWYDQTQSRQGVTAPTATNPIVLDGTQANKPIEFTNATSAASLTVQNGYSNTLITDLALSTGGNDTVNSGCILTIVSKSSMAGVVLTNGANFTVASGGTLKLTDPVGTNVTGVRFLEAFDTNQGEYLNNAGTVTWTGTAGAAGKSAFEDSIEAPILNTGTFNADGGTNGNTTLIPAILEIYFQDQNKTNNVSFYQTSGSFNLKDGAYVKAQDGYYQSGGSLTSDSSAGSQACGLVGGFTGHGDINIAGGKVVVDTVPNSVGTLQFVAGTAEINGEIDVDGQPTGGKSNLCDLLDCTQVSTVTLQTNSFLNVGTTGTAALGTGNQWTVMTYPMNELTGSWGTIRVPTGMTASIGPQKILVSN